MGKRCAFGWHLKHRLRLGMTEGPVGGQQRKSPCCAPSSPLASVYCKNMDGVRRLNLTCQH